VALSGGLTDEQRHHDPTHDPTVRAASLAEAARRAGRHLAGRWPGGQRTGVVPLAGRRLLPGTGRRHGAGRRDDQGLEIIGHDEESDALASHYFDNAGNHFTYTWELEGDRLTIWFGPAGSPGVFRGTFAEDRNGLSGAWTWPGGGYESTMTRVADGPA